MAAALTNRKRLVLLCLPNNSTGLVIRVEGFKDITAQMP